MIKPKLHTLNNGLRVLLVPIKDAPSVTTAVSVKAGSSYENERNSGISHFLEHMCFKGTSKYPNPSDVAVALEKIGAEHNAFTDRDWTAYYAKTAPRYFKRAFDVVSELYLYPHISDIEMEKEKGVIIEEIHMYDDNPRYKVGEMLERGLYGNQPAGWSIAGTEQHIKNTTRDMFVSYRNARYIPKHTVVTIAGAFDGREALHIVEKTFGSVRGAQKGPLHAPKLQKSKRGDSISIIERKLDQTHFALGFYGEPMSSKNRFAIALMTKILGGSMSSRLFQRVREDLGAAYYVGSSQNAYATHGYVDVFAGVNHGKFEEALKAIIKEIRLMVKDGVSEKELQRAQDYSIGTFMLSLESSSDLAFYYGQQETVLGKTQSPQDIVKEIKKVTVKDINALARKIFNLQTMRFAVVGPHQKNKKSMFEKIVRG